MAVYQIVTWILAAAGLWKIFGKCGEKGWWGIIPGVRYYKIGVCAGRKRESIVCMVLELLSGGLRVVTDLLPAETAARSLLLLAVIVLVIAMLVFEVRVIGGLVEVFGLGKGWILLWLIFPWLAALLIGFGKKHQPVAPAEEDEGDLIAGTKPAELQTAVDREESDEGLVIHVRARTVKQNRQTRYLLKDIHLTVPNGSLVLLLGGSGSGKTTLINAVNGYEKADADVRLNGRDIYKEYEEMKYRIGFVPQQELMRMKDTVSNTLDDAAKLRLPVQVTPEERKETIEGVMDVLGLTGGRDGLVGKKSGGMKKRISIGMELLSDPDLFILDEPDSGLDGVIARELFEKLRTIADQGKIVIAITHTPDRVADLFDKVIVLARDSGKVGRLAFYGSPDEARGFFDRPTMEQIIMAINPKDAGGEGRADEFIEKYAALTVKAAEEKQTDRKEDPDGVGEAADGED